MARSQAFQSENNFIGGLVTETTALRFPKNACTDVDNCVFDFTGTIARRKGFDYEPSYVLNSLTSPTSGEAYTEYHWSAVGGDGNINFVVQQQGDTLHFFNASSNIDISANKKTFTIALSDYLPDDSALSPSTEPCQFASNNGYLVVVNRHINPFYVTYDSSADTVTGTVIKPKIRDIVGLEDGLGVIKRPTESLSSLKTNNPEHAYNLYNQGWYVGTALTSWDTDRTDMPSNADFVALYRASATDSFDNARVGAQAPGNTYAPRGHYILEAALPDRVAALAADGITGIALDGPIAEIDQFTGSNFRGSSDNINFGNVAQAFGPDTSVSGSYFTSSANNTVFLVGKSFTTPTTCAQVTVRGCTESSHGFVVGSNPSVTLTLYGKQGSVPANSTDGTSLGTATFTDDTTTHTITSSDTSTLWDHLWVRMSVSSNAQLVFGYVQLFSKQNTTEYVNSPYRFKTTASFAGRIWYAGMDGINLNGSLFFSRIIDKPQQFEKCHQENDPTSETNADLLPDDGGVIRIPEIGSVIKLFAYQTSLLVFATNGVWRVAGGSTSNFRANDYQVRKISSIGMKSPLSIVDYRGIPAWWGEDGIYTIKYDANYDSFDAVSLTDATIASFYQDIPNNNRKYAKGCYDYVNRVGYWLYNDDEAPSDNYSYNKVLCLDGQINAFFPWSIGTNDDGVVKGILFTVPADQSVPGQIKYTTTGTGSTFTYSEHNDDTYYDWTTPNTTPADYTSYFNTGFRIDGQGMKYFQPNYIIVFLNTVANSSCFMRAKYDWTNSADSGKWSTAQQIYNSTLADRDVNHRRLKIRGKGKALQFYFYSEAGKPFEIIGWSLWETSNGGL